MRKKVRSNHTPHADARGATVPRIGRGARAGGRERYVPLALKL